MKKIKQILFLTLTLFIATSSQIFAKTYSCGNVVPFLSFNEEEDVCNCEGGSFAAYSVSSGTGVSTPMICCGIVEISWGTSYCSVPETPNTGTPAPQNSPTTFPIPDAETLDSLNPLKIAEGDESLSNPGTLISKAVNNFVFPIAGIILFLMLVFGGFQMLLGATNNKSLEEGKQRVTSAIIGFIILFASYWIVQLIELIFGFSILG